MTKETVNAYAGLGAALLLLAAPVSHAQQMEPRSYSNAPIGLNFLPERDRLARPPIDPSQAACLAPAQRYLVTAAGLGAGSTETAMASW
jgi:hypothetical protein